MKFLCKLVLMSGVAMAAVFPAMAQQGQQPGPTEHGAHHGGADQQTDQPAPGGGGGMMGQGSMMGQGQGGQGMQGGGMMGQGGGMMGQGGQGGGMMGGCPMMSGMMQSGQGGGGQGMGGQGMMGQGMQGMTGQGSIGCPWCGPGMMGSGYATPQPSINLSVNDVKAYLDRWVTGNPNIQVANIVEQDANTITADIVTKDKSGLVQRYTFDRRTGYYHTVQ